MSFDCRAHRSNCVTCNRAKPSRHGSLSLSPLGILDNLRGIFGTDFVTDLPKISKFNFTPILIFVFNLTKIANFVPFHKEIKVEEIVDLFIDNCYNLHGVP